MVQRDIVLAKATGAAYHVMHVSSAGAVDSIRQAKSQQLPVTTEVCPHHLLLTDEACKGYDPNFKMSPPLRSGDDVRACIEGVGDGTIDCLVSDHAPHKEESKQLEFSAAPFGILGMETSLGLFVKALVAPGVLDWPGLIARMTVNPAGILRLSKGALGIGADADVTICDPDLRWTVDVSSFRSRSTNTPFDGWELTGKAVCTIVGGLIRFREPDSLKTR